MESYYRLIASRSFREASIEEIFSCCNGTGAHGSLVAKWIPEWVKGLGIRLTAASFIHDWDYMEGTTLKDKELADLHYFENLCSIIRWHGGSMMTIRILLAKAYYWLVSTHGDKAFRKSKMQ